MWTLISYYGVSIVLLTAVHTSLAGYVQYAHNYIWMGPFNKSTNTTESAAPSWVVIFPPAPTGELTRGWFMDNSSKDLIIIQYDPIVFIIPIG